MKCIAIDDEPIALSIINNYCQRIADIDLKTFTNPLQGIKEIQENTPDVVFLDIEMNDYSGLELARQLPSNCILIFTTAHASYALDGYEVNAVDFLHKPFSFDRFESSLARARHILDIRAKAKSADNVPENQITVKVEYQNVTFLATEITYIEAMDNYIKINTIDNRSVLTKMSIKAFMEFLPENDFIRIHRSFIVGKAHIASFTKQNIKLQGSRMQTLPVGRNYAENLYTTMMSLNA